MTDTPEEPETADEEELPEKAAARLAAEVALDPPAKPRHGHQARQWNRQ